MSDRAALIISCSRQQAATIHQRAELERRTVRSEEHTSELQSRLHLVCRLLLEKKEEFLSPTTRLAALDSAKIAGVGSVTSSAKMALPPGPRPLASQVCHCPR